MARRKKKIIMEGRPEMAAHVKSDGVSCAAGWVDGGKKKKKKRSDFFFFSADSLFCHQCAFCKRGRKKKCKKIFFSASPDTWYLFVRWRALVFSHGHARFENTA